MNNDIRDLLSRMADELDYLKQLLRDSRERHPLATTARAALAAAPEGMRRTIKVRVAVSVDCNGDWKASGWSSSSPQDFHAYPNSLEPELNRYLLEAELQVPEMKTVTAHAIPLPAPQGGEVGA